LVRPIYQSASSPVARLAAFLALTQIEPASAQAALIEAALKSDDDLLRQAALRRGLELKLPQLEQDLAGSIDQLAPGDRLVVLANLQFVQPAAAEAIALACTKAADENERVAALVALGRLATKPAFEALLQAVGAREPAINRAAGSALATMNYPAADASLLAMINDGPTADKVLAIKAAACRALPGLNPLLIGIIIRGADQESAREAMKTLYLTATLDDLRVLCGAAKSATDPPAAARLAPLCTRIAGRFESDEARKLVEGLK
jgi:HEAT repeat protein